MILYTCYSVFSLNIGQCSFRSYSLLIIKISNHSALASRAYTSGSGQLLEDAPAQLLYGRGDIAIAIQSPMPSSKGYEFL